MEPTPTEDYETTIRAAQTELGIYHFVGNVLMRHPPVDREPMELAVRERHETVFSDLTTEDQNMALKLLVQERQQEANG